MSTTRSALIVLLLGATGLAHGGAFRPPPRSGPRDPVRGPARPGPVTRGPSAQPLTPWEYWWNLNRERYLRLRERMVEREVITGTQRRTDLFDRRALRENVLAPEVLVALRDPDEEVRTAAAVAAGKFRTPSAVPVLLRMFKRDKVKQVREAALLGLMLMRDRELTGFFRGVVLDSKQDRRLRAFSVLALGFLGESGFLEQVELGKGLRLIGSGVAVDDLKACAALALGYAGDQSRVGTLIATATSRSAPRAAVGFAASALGRLGNPIAAPDVIGLVKDNDARTEARYGAAISCGRLVRPTETAVIDLLGRKAQRDKNGGVRALLVISLGRIGGERAMTHVVAGMTKCEQRLRGFHYLAIGIAGSSDAAALMFEEFDRLKDNSDRAACALGLGLAGYKAAAPRLRKELKRKNIGFAPHAMVALGLLDDRESIPLVEEIVRKSRDAVMQREGAIALALLRRSAAVPVLVDLLQRSKSLYTRGSVATALGLVGTDKAVGPLLEILKDRKRQPEERALALVALGRIGDPEPIPLLTRIAFDLNPYVVIDAVGEVLTIL